MIKLVLLLCLLTTPALAEELDCVQTDKEVVCTFQDEQLLEELSPKVVIDDSPFGMPKAAPAIVMPIVRVIVIEVVKSAAVDLIKSKILEAYMKNFPKKPMPTVKLVKAH